MSFFGRKRRKNGSSGKSRSGSAGNADEAFGDERLPASPSSEGGMQRGQMIANMSNQRSYVPPHLTTSADTLDDIINSVDKNDNLDKYRTPDSSAGEQNRDFHHQASSKPQILQSPLPMTSKPQPAAQKRPQTDPPEASSTIVPPALRVVVPDRPTMNSRRGHSPSHRGLAGSSFEPVQMSSLETMESGTFETEGETLQTSYTSQSENLVPPTRTRKVRSRDNYSECSSTGTYHDNYESWIDHGNSSYLYKKQTVSWWCIASTAVQFMILITQMILCGVASVDVNPLIGPYPDAFSEWGGKNAYLMIEKNQWYRLITPVFLSVGLLQFLAHTYCALETAAWFEREWGTTTFFFLYVAGGMASVATSCVFDPDEVAVSSSGPLLAIFGVKLAQIITWTTFELTHPSYFDSVNLDHVGGIFCSMAMLLSMSFVTYIDFSGNMGGLGFGFLMGMLVFCKPINDCCVQFLWAGLSFSGIVCAVGALGYYLANLETDEDMGDACNYFRNLFPEGYRCECVWD